MECKDGVLGCFSVTYGPDGKIPWIVEAPQVFETANRSPQLALRELGDAQ